MRALLYYASLCVDREMTEEDEAKKEKWHGILEVLTPICKAYNSDIGFRVTETAIQVFGGYGYCSEYPVEQIMRDEKIASIYEGTSGIQALDLVGRKLPRKNGASFMALLGEIGKTVKKYKGVDTLSDLTTDVQNAANTLGEMGLFFAQSAGEGNFLLPISNAYPFLIMMGKVVAGWLLLWEAGVANEKLDAIAKDKGVDRSGKAALNNLAKESKEGAFYLGKIISARYFIKNVLPEVDAAATAIKNKDMSVMDMAEESFAS